jgi:membrane protease YdiL (CAAX protease family)
MISLAIDFILFGLLAIVFPLWSYLTWPRFLADARNQRPGVRVRGYVEMMITLWGLALGLLVNWGLSARPWAALGLGDPLAGHGPYAFAVVIGVGVLAFVHARSVARAPREQLAAERGKLGDVLYVLPHTALERRLFAGVAVTAGVCEELFFRGLAPSLLSLWLPPWLAIAVATLLFGLAHAYQGPAGIPKTALVGAVMAGLTLWAGNLWPAMLLHTIVDLHGGSVGGRITRTEPLVVAPVSAGVERA